MSTDLDPSDLRLHHKVVVLGGGKQAHMRGGDIRRMVIHSDALQGPDVMDVYLRLANDHPGIGGRAVRIQAVYRGYMMRKRRDEEIARNKAEFDRENAEEEAAEEKKEEVEGNKKEEGKEGESAQVAAGEGEGAVAADTGVSSAEAKEEVEDPPVVAAVA